MEIKNFIKIYDNLLPLETLSNFIKVINTFKFEEAKIYGNQEKTEVNKNIRNTEVFGMGDFFQSNDMKGIHWTNLMLFFIKQYSEKYIQDCKLNFNLTKIESLDCLKYRNNGFYTWHVDAGASINRILSIVYLLNNDYEGGNLCFRDPDGSNEWEIEVRPNRMIIWPSNFLFPHTVKPVTKGTRYSIVSWVI
jgi:hypothetical protein